MPLVDLPANAALDAGLVDLPAGAQLDAPTDNSGFFGPAARVAGGMAEGLAAAMQRTSPIVQQIGGKSNYQPIGEAVPANQNDLGKPAFAAGGQWQAIDPAQHVVLSDPATGKPMVYARSPSTDENVPLSLGRMLGFGMLAPSNIAAPTIGAGATRLIGNRFAKPEDSAMRQVGEAMRADAAVGGPGPQQIEDALTAAGPPSTVLDVAGENVRGLGGQVARMPGPGRQDIMQTLNDRDALSGGRLAQSVNDLGASGDGNFLTAQALHNEAKTAAAPLYGKAYMVPPLSSERLQSFMDDPILKTGLAQGTEIQRLEDLAANRSLPQGYTPAWDEGLSGGASPVAASAAPRTPNKPVDLVEHLIRNGGVQDFGGELAAMDMDKAVKGYFGRLARGNGKPLDQARESAEEAGYLPQGSTINDLLDGIYDTTHGSAVYSAKDAGQVANWEHYLKTGEVPGPAVMKPSGDFAKGGALDPNVAFADVPREWTMRQVDAAKRGLDNMLEQFRDPTSGRLQLDPQGRAIDQVRRAFLGEVDQLNPDYAAARAAYAGPEQSRGAVLQGAQALNKNPDEIAADIGRLSPGDQNFYRLGAANALKTQLAKTSSGGDEARALIGNAYRQEQLRRIFPNADGLINAARGEKTMFDTRTQTIGNSLTAARAAQDAGGEGGGWLRPLGEMAVGLGTHEPLVAAKAGVSALQNLFKNGKMSPEVGAKIAEFLLSTDPQTARAWLMNAFDRAGPATARLRPMTPIVDQSAQQFPMIGERGRQ